MADQLPHETQQQRWIKYGANVVLTSVVVILIAALVTYMFQRTNSRLDTTQGGMYSLKPQTVNLIGDLKGKTKIVSLYSKEIRDERTDVMVKSPYIGPVADLLDEYRRKGKNIEIDSIDPIQNPPKVDDLITEVTKKYSAELKKYNEVLEAYPKVYEQITQLALTETERISKLPVDQLGQDDESQTTRVAVVTVRGLKKMLDSSTTLIKKRLDEKPPAYKAAVTRVEDDMDTLSQTAAKIIEIFGKTKDDTKVPEPIRQYMADPATTKAYTDLKKLADDLLKQAKGVGELKLDDLRQSLRARDAILVMGETDMRVIPFEQVWKVDDQQIRQFNPGQELKPRFAGEQQITTAILALNNDKKTKVAFIRTGGPPLTTPAMLPFQRGGPMSVVADRLRQYNFEVLEKDLSGMWAMQAQMQQMPAPPEPSDEQIKDAIWIVLNMPMTQQNPQMPSPPIAPKVAEHLKAGGSAMILFAPKTPQAAPDTLPETLKEWGIDLRADAVAVHQMVKQSEGRQQEMMDDALRYPFVFDIRDYGNHLITRPIQSLSSLFLPLEIVQTTKEIPAGVKVTPILPIPNNPESWGETDLEALEKLEEIKYDEGKDVKGGNLFGGAVAEREKGGRLVVIASPMFAFDRWVDMPDPNLIRRGLIVSRYPANAELFCNSVFWLAKMEPMIAISPAAMEVSRISSMTPAGRAFWKIYMLLVLLPGAVVVSGVLVWFARRD